MELKTGQDLSTTDLLHNIFFCIRDIEKYSLYLNGMRISPSEGLSREEISKKLTFLVSLIHQRKITEKQINDVISGFSDKAFVISASILNQITEDKSKGNTDEKETGDVE